MVEIEKQCQWRSSRRFMFLEILPAVKKGAMRIAHDSPSEEKKRSRYRMIGFAVSHRSCAPSSCSFSNDEAWWKLTYSKIIITTNKAVEVHMMIKLELLVLKPWTGQKKERMKKLRVLQSNLNKIIQLQHNNKQGPESGDEWGYSDHQKKFVD